MKHKEYTAYSIVTSLAEEAILAAVVLRVLPELGIDIPAWGLVFMMFTLGAYNYVSYWIGKRTLDRKPIVSPDIGSRGITTTQLTPRGYVKVGSELWRATSTSSNIDEGREVVVTGVEGLTLLVAPQEDKAKH
jgi:membrane protein implicated in regulation of membrane protease activity